MEITIAEAIKITEGLNEILSTKDHLGRVIEKAPVFPARFSIEMAFLSDEILPIIKNYNKVKSELLEKYGQVELNKKGEKTGNYFIDPKSNPENYPAFIKDLNKLEKNG